MDAPKTGKCYCDCKLDTQGHFRPGHDLRVAARLTQGQSGRTTDRAASLEREYGSVVQAQLALEAKR
jgi:hypothetical protein